MHRSDDSKVGKAVVGDFLGNQGFRNDASHVPSRGQNGIRQRAHQSNPSPTINEPHFLATNDMPQFLSRSQIFSLRSRVGSRKDTDSLHGCELPAARRMSPVAIPASVSTTNSFSRARTRRLRSSTESSRRTGTLH